MMQTEKPAASRRRTIMRGVGIVAFFTLFSRILGATRDLVIAHLFGAGAAMDAFSQAFTIPNILRRLTAEGAMTLAFIPLYTQLRGQDSQAQAKAFARRALGLVLLVTGILVGLGMIFSRQIVMVIAPGFIDEPEKFTLTVELTRLMFPYLLLVSVVAWAMGVLNSEKKFAAPAAAPVLLNVSILVTAVFFRDYFDAPMHALGWGVVIGGVLQVLLQWPALWQIKQPFQPRWPLGDPYIKELLRLLGPSLFGVAVYQINMIVLRQLASFLPTGQVSYYYFSNLLTELVLGVFAFSIATASFPTLSEFTGGKQWREALQTLEFSFVTTMMIVIPSAIGLFAVAEPIVAMLFLHGEMTWDDVVFTAATLQAFAVSIPAVAIVRLMVSVYYALKDTRTPVIISAVTLLVTALAGWLLSLRYEVVGLALGLSIGTWFQALVLIIFLGRFEGMNRSWLAWRTLAIYTGAGLLMGLSAWWAAGLGAWSAGFRDLGNWLVLSAVIAAAAVIYFGLLFISGDQHIKASIQLLKRKLLRRA